METSRVQLALNVADIAAATRFYSDLFGVEPAKQRPGTPTLQSPTRRSNSSCSRTHQRHHR